MLQIRDFQLAGNDDLGGKALSKKGKHVIHIFHFSWFQRRVKMLPEFLAHFENKLK